MKWMMDVEFKKDGCWMLNLRKKQNLFTKSHLKERRRRKNCGNAYEQVKKDGSSENMGSDSDKDCYNLNVSHCSNLSEFSK